MGTLEGYRKEAAGAAPYIRGVGSVHEANMLSRICCTRKREELEMEVLCCIGHAVYRAIVDHCWRRGGMWLTKTLSADPELPLILQIWDYEY